jgi:hypothetical protein
VHVHSGHHATSPPPTVVLSSQLIAEGQYGAAKRTVSALLAQRDNKDRFVIKASDKAFFSASVHYVDLDREGALRLKAALDDALNAMR